MIDRKLSTSQLSFSRSILAAVLICIFTPANSFATSYSCDTVASRVVNSAAIVVGHTIAYGTTDSSGQHKGPYRYRIDEVIKGAMLNKGDIHTEECASEWSLFLGCSHLPMLQQGQTVEFLSFDSEGNLRAGPCAESIINISRLRRMAEVDAHPEKYLHSDDNSDVAVILYWIEKQHAPSIPSFLRVTATQPADLSREEAIHVVRRIVDRREPLANYGMAIDLLGRFRRSDDLDRLTAALESDQPWIIQKAAFALESLGDKRASPFVRRRISTWREASKKAIELIDSQMVQSVAKNDALRSAKSSNEQTMLYLSNAYSRLADSDCIPELREMFGAGDCPSAAEALARLQDRESVEPMLELYWAGQLGLEPLVELNDPRIVEQARPRMHDDPRACRLLAWKGDPGAKEFMLKLLGQGHEDGVRWAAVSRDPDALPLLWKALGSASGSALYDIPFALGRFQDFSAVALLRQRFNGKPSNPYWPMSFLAGVTNYNLRERPTRRERDVVDIIEERINEIAQKGQWSQTRRETVRSLIADARKPMDEYYPRHLYAREGQRWTPPAKLPDLPGVYSPAVLADYVRINHERIIQAIRTSPDEDRAKILRVVSQSDIEIADEEWVDLLLDKSIKVRNAALSNISQGGRLKRRLSIEAVAAWALRGEVEATRSALRYMVWFPDRRYGTVLTQLLKRDSLLTESNLFDAIIGCKAEACREILKSYLTGQQPQLSLHAAIALAYLGDDSGRAVLLRNRKPTGEPTLLRSGSAAGALKLLGEMPENPH
jgi:HEAT repeat protein